MLCQPKKIPHELITVGILDYLRYLYDFFYSVNSNVKCLCQDFAIQCIFLEKGWARDPFVIAESPTVNNSIAPTPHAGYSH